MAFSSLKCHVFSKCPPVKCDMALNRLLGDMGMICRQSRRFVCRDAIVLNGINNCREVDGRNSQSVVVRSSTQRVDDSGGGVS